jgi:hypothetical protein
MASDSEALEEDNTYVHYGESGELVFNEEEKPQKISIQELLPQTEEITSESDWSEQSSPQKKVVKVQENKDIREKRKGSRDSGSPVQECDFTERKLKFHVQSEHLPRILWDNPQPPIRDTKTDEWTEWRYQLLLFLARVLDDSDSVDDSVKWTEVFATPHVPSQSKILDRGQEQLRKLSRWMRWSDPGTFQLTPMNSPSVLIH